MKVDEKACKLALLKCFRDGESHSSDYGQQEWQRANDGKPPMIFAKETIHE